MFYCMFYFTCDRFLTFKVDPTAAVRVDVSDHIVNVSFSQVVTELLQNPSAYNIYTTLLAYESLHHLLSLLTCPGV